MLLFEAGVGDAPRLTLRQQRIARKTNEMPFAARSRTVRSKSKEALSLLQGEERSMPTPAVYSASC